jgi:hypothetical protein
MTAIASTDVTVTVSDIRVIGRERRTTCSIAFSLTTLTYTSATGVPMPAYSAFGMYRQLKYLSIIDNSRATGVVWKWDYTNGVLRPFQAPAQTHLHNVLVKGSATTTDAAVQSSATVLHRGDGTTTDITITSNATNGGVVSTTLAVGDLTELANTGTLAAATTIVAIAVGW